MKEAYLGEEKPGTMAGRDSIRVEKCLMLHTYHQEAEHLPGMMEAELKSRVEDKEGLNCG